jgi:hypothetical protein
MRKSEPKQFPFCLITHELEKLCIFRNKITTRPSKMQQTANKRKCRCSVSHCKSNNDVVNSYSKMRQLHNGCRTKEPNDVVWGEESAFLLRRGQKTKHSYSNSSWFSSIRPGICQDSTSEILPWALPFTTFQFIIRHYSSVIPQFNVVIIWATDSIVNKMKVN